MNRIRIRIGGEYRYTMIKIIDHEGNEFRSISKMCEYWGVDRVTYNSRISCGLSIEEALSKDKMSSVDIENRTDHEGREFKSIREMCKHWGVGYYCYLDRIKIGLYKEKALTTGAHGLTIERRTDHNGKIFEDIGKMCEYWGTSVGSYRGRIKNGYTKEQALTAVLNSKDKRTDHEGNEFNSVADMCEYWNVDYTLYMNRIRIGWSKGRALTGETVETDIESRTDHTGIVYKSVRIMCQNWGVVHQTYHKRVTNGWSKEEALGGNGRGLEQRIRNGEQINDKVVILGKAYTGIDGRVYYDVEIEDGRGDIMSADEIKGYE